MSERWTAVRLSEIPGFAEQDRPRWHMVRSVLGIEAFGINAWTATGPQQHVIGEHDELGAGAGRHEEVYLVVTGRARFTLDGETVDAPAGTIVHVPDPSVRRSAVADAGTTVLVIGGRAGAAFAVSPWERSAEALRHWSTGDWNLAIEALHRQLDEQPQDASVLYNLACAESRAGRVEAAIGHLLEAVALEPRFVETAQADDDLVALRRNPRFPRPPAPETSDPT
jgi:tetratricopeptide (TPR) repeat protein